MSDTSPKKNSLFDKILLGVAGTLAIGMLAAGPAKEPQPAPDKEEVAEKEEAKNPAPVVKTPEAVAEAKKKVAAMEKELAKTKQANKDLEAQLRTSNMALEMKGGNPAEFAKSKEALKKAQASLASKESEIEQLKGQLTKTKGTKPGDQSAKMSEIEEAKNKAEAELKRLKEATEKARKALEDASK